MTNEKILEALQPLITDNKLNCPDALALAAKLEIEPRLIGKVCNQNRIQLVNCQLGCFGVKEKRTWAND